MSDAEEKEERWYRIHERLGISWGHYRIPSGYIMPEIMRQMKVVEQIRENERNEHTSPSCA